MKLNRIPWFLALVVTGTLVASTFSFAADEKEGGILKDKPAGAERAGKPKARIDQLTEMLQLSQEQVAKIRPVLQEENKKMRELKQDTSLEGKDKKVKIREARAVFKGKIKEILTPDQIAKWEKSQTDLEPRGAGRGQGPDAERPKRNGAPKEGNQKPSKEK